MVRVLLECGACLMGGVRAMVLAAWVMARVVLFLAIAASCRALPPAPPAPADADAAPVCILAATECACARLCELACEECDPACVAVLDTIIADRVIAIDVECIAAASNKPAVRACGGIRCAE